MAASEQYVVAGLQIVVKLGGGNEVYLSQGAPVPAAADPDHLKHLLARGLVRQKPAEIEDESKTASKK